MSHPTLRSFARDGARTDMFHPQGMLAAFAASLSETVRIWIARARERQALREMAERDDRHLLADIGVTREEAFRAATKRFWQR